MVTSPEESEPHDMRAILEPGEVITHMAVSPDGELLALFTRDYRLLVVSMDLESCRFRLDFMTTRPVLISLHWCGPVSLKLLGPIMSHGVDVCTGCDRPQR